VPIIEALPIINYRVVNEQAHLIQDEEWVKGASSGDDCDQTLLMNDDDKKKNKTATVESVVW